MKLDKIISIPDIIDENQENFKELSDTYKKVFSGHP